MMRRVAVAGVLALFGLSACTNQVPGADGDLVNGWPKLSAVEQFEPAAKTCHSAAVKVSTFSGYDPIDCGESHRAETAHVGTFTGPAAERTSPPALSSPDIVDAYRECDDQATAFVGRDWRDMHLELRLLVPSPAAWQGGARYFRCDLVQVQDFASSWTEVARTSTVSGASDAGLLLTCFQESRDGTEAIDCAKPHNMEYAGSFQASASMRYPKSETDWDRLHDQCFKLAARYVGLSVSKYEAGVYSWPADEEFWNSGDHGVRCFVWLNKGSMKGSAEDGKGKGLTYKN